MKAERAVAIVGCGSAGPALAVLLARQGWRVRLFERAPECRAVGAGFLLQPTGMKVLGRLGVLDGVLEHGARVKRLHVVTAGGAELLDLSYEEIGAGLFGLGLHRPVLLRHLLQAMAREGLSVDWGREVVSGRRRPDGWEVESADGRREGGFDLLVGADGARSTMRGMLGFPGGDRGYPWGAHWFIGENRGVFPEDELHQVVEGTRRLAGFLATGREHPDGPGLVSLFWSIRLDEDERLRAGSLDAWKDQVRAHCPLAENLLEQIDDWSQVLTARYGDVRMASWHDDDCVLLGDAAHALSPQLGQGVNLALQDAACLADCLAELPLSRALAEYSRRRRMVLAYYGLATRQLTPWFQSEHEWLTPARRLFFRTMQRIGPARRFMTRSMAGLAMGGDT